MAQSDKFKLVSIWMKRFKETTPEGQWLFLGQLEDPNPLLPRPPAKPPLSWRPPRPVVNARKVVQHVDTEPGQQHAGELQQKKALVNEAKQSTRLPHLSSKRMVADTFSSNPDTPNANTAVEHVGAEKVSAEKEDAEKLDVEKVAAANLTTEKAAAKIQTTGTAKSQIATRKVAAEKAVAEGVAKRSAAKKDAEKSSQQKGSAEKKTTDRAAAKKPALGKAAARNLASEDVGAGKICAAKDSGPKVSEKAAAQKLPIGSATSTEKKSAAKAAATKAGAEKNTSKQSAADAATKKPENATRQDAVESAPDGNAIENHQSMERAVATEAVTPKTAAGNKFSEGVALSTAAKVEEVEVQKTVPEDHVARNNATGKAEEEVDAELTVTENTAQTVLTEQPAADVEDVSKRYVARSAAAEPSVEKAIAGESGAAATCGTEVETASADEAAEKEVTTVLDNFDSESFVAEDIVPQTEGVENYIMPALVANTTDPGTATAEEEILSEAEYEESFASEFFEEHAASRNDAADNYDTSKVASNTVNPGMATTGKGVAEDMEEVQEEVSAEADYEESFSSEAVEGCAAAQTGTVENFAMSTAVTGTADLDMSRTDENVAEETEEVQEELAGAEYEESFASESVEED